MKVLFIHNDYGKPSGEEHASGELASLLQSHGHEVRWFKRSSAEIAGHPLKLLKSFFTGIYNPAIIGRLDKVIAEFKPDVAQVQNLYPFLSTAIFRPLKKRGIPVVMRCPNYRLFCPNGLCLDPAGEICERCFHGAREWWCVRKNCENSWPKSIGYAARNCYARLSKNIVNGVDVFIVQSAFQMQKFVSQGIPESRIAILPGIAPVVTVPSTSDKGDYVTFVGRVSAEKGIYEFINAARRLPHIPFKVAGNLDSSLKLPSDLPQNLEFVGFVGGSALDELYLRSRIIVVPSKWYEGFPNVIVRGMLLERPIVTTNIGAMQSIIDDGINGRLFNVGDVDGLVRIIDDLWRDPALCSHYGKAGKQKADCLYSREVVYDTLINIYNTAISRH